MQRLFRRQLHCPGGLGAGTMQNPKPRFTIVLERTDSGNQKLESKNSGTRIEGNSKFKVDCRKKVREFIHSSKSRHI
jgi:hypothetical protein